jgi:hypothetical protein
MLGRDAAHERHVDLREPLVERDVRTGERERPRREDEHREADRQKACEQCQWP